MTIGTRNILATHLIKRLFQYLNTGCSMKKPGSLAGLGFRIFVFGRWLFRDPP